MNKGAHVLNSRAILSLIKEKGLVTSYIHLDTQLTPNGFDLTAQDVFEFGSAGALDFSNKERALPSEKRLEPVKKKKGDCLGWWKLKRGAYKVRTNEIVTLPQGLIAIAFPRSSLLRMGCFCHNGVWDAGFSGKSEFILVVENPAGLNLKQNARLVQLVFMRMDKGSRTYNGIYQHHR